MLITKEIKIKINNRYVKYYKELGYNVKGGDEIVIPIKHLSEQSHIKVECKCDNCDTITNINYYNYILNIKNQGKYYCKKCKHLKSEKTNLEKYGVKSTLQSNNVIKKIKEKNKEKYGVEHYSQTNEYKELIKKKNQEKYGVDWFFQTDEYLEKKKRTNQEKYGVDFYSQTDEYLEKKKRTNQEKYGENFYSQTKDFKEKVIQNTINRYENKDIKVLKILENDIEIKCDKGHTYILSKDLLKNRLRFNIEPCLICNPINNHISDKENKLLDFIKENYNGKIITNDRKILDGKELDIYLPELNLAFEFNGIYWHNELYKENKYHFNKTEKCEEKGIHLFHVWEDHWNYKQDIIKSMILNKLGKTKNKIGARKCKIKEINDNKLIRKFLDENHLQGFVGSKEKLGLFYKEELVSLMTFGKKRTFMNSKSLENEYELLRFCNKLNTNIIGGANKLFKYFIKTYNPEEIISYADRSHSQGNLYNKLGFNFVSKTPPNYYYIIDDMRKHRFGFRKDVLIKQGYNKDMTEHEIMFSRKIYRVYDSGSLKFTKSMKCFNI